jgi:hypothetical protein
MATESIEKLNTKKALERKLKGKSDSEYKKRKRRDHVVYTSWFRTRQLTLILHT